MNTGEKIYQHIINNDKIYKDYFTNNEQKEQTIEDLFKTFLCESELADSAKIKILQKNEGKKTVFEYFDSIQTNFNIMFYDMKI